MIFRPDHSQIYQSNPASEILVPQGGRSALYNSLQVFWKMDEASGNRLDSLPGGLGLVDNNTVTSATGHVYSLAASFASGSVEFLSQTDSVPLSTGNVDFWMAAWVRVASGSAATMTVISKDDSSTNREYRFYLNRVGSNDFRPTMLVMNNGGANASVAWASNMGVNAFSLIVGYHDSVNDLVGVSVDGGTPVTTPYSGGAADSTAGLTVGRLTEGATQYMNGRIGPAMVGKNYVPTLDDIAFLYNAGAGRTLDAMAGQ